MMSKRGQMSKAEIYFIQGHRDTHDVSQLAKELDRTEGQIQRVLHDLPAPESVHEAPEPTIMADDSLSVCDEKIVEFAETKQARKFRVPTGDTFARRKGENGEVRAVIMTPAASQLSDGRRRKNTKEQDHIHKPLGNKNG